MLTADCMARQPLRNPVRKRRSPQGARPQPPPCVALEEAIFRVFRVWAALSVLVFLQWMLFMGKHILVLQNTNSIINLYAVTQHSEYFFHLFLVVLIDTNRQ